MCPGAGTRSSYEQSVAGQEAPPAPSARSRWDTVTDWAVTVERWWRWPLPFQASLQGEPHFLGRAAQSLRPSDQQVLDLQWLPHVTGETGPLCERVYIQTRGFSC